MENSEDEVPRVPVDFRTLGPEQVDWIVAITNDRGPFEDDLHYFVFSGENAWRIGLSEAEGLFEWFSRFPEFDFEKSIRASACIENRRFVLWRREGLHGFGDQARDRLANRLTEALVRARETWQIGPSASEDLTRSVETVLEAYGEVRREYHGLRHLLQIFWELDQLPEELLSSEERLKVELAVWFHDLVYDVKRRDNEIQSAKACEYTLRLGGIGKPEGAAAIAEIVLLIELSTHRGPPPLVNQEGSRAQNTLELFLDLDMSILGQPEVVYSEYAQNVRLEYSHVSDWTYAHFRKRFLRHVIAHGAFRSSYFRARYGQLADANLRREFFEQYPKWIPPWAL
jgi:predicted metal-dependent HD superfamily phosphohydrolase